MASKTSRKVGPERTYFDEVWQQFRRNRAAYASLWLLAPMFGVALAAPVLCSNQPFMFWDQSRWIFPWFRALFIIDEPINYLFNMGLLALAPWAVWMVARRRWGSTKRVSTRAQLARGTFYFILIATTLAGVFAVWAWGRLRARKDDTSSQPPLS